MHTSKIGLDKKLTLSHKIKQIHDELKAIQGIKTKPIKQKKVESKDIIKKIKLFFTKLKYSTGLKHTELLILKEKRPELFKNKLKEAEIKKVLFEFPKLKFESKLIKLKKQPVKITLSTTKDSVILLSELLDEYKKSLAYGINVTISHQIELFLLYQNIYTNLLFSDIKNTDKKSLRDQLKALYEELKVLQKTKPKKIKKISVVNSIAIEKPIEPSEKLEILPPEKPIEEIEAPEKPIGEVEAPEKPIEEVEAPERPEIIDSKIKIKPPELIEGKVEKSSKKEYNKEKKELTDRYNELLKEIETELDPSLAKKLFKKISLKKSKRK